VTNSDTIAKYRTLLREIDTWFSTASAGFPEHIRCASGCSGCCRGLFDITLLDAALLDQGFSLLPYHSREDILRKAHARLLQLREIWPDLTPPFILNHRPEAEWTELMPEGDETPCVLLDDDGRCLVYNHRPMTCRLHGLPLVDVFSGEVLHDEWCTENFTACDPLQLPELAAPFDRIFRDEVKLGREFTRELLGEVVYELDTFIPLALLLDNDAFDWRRWWEKKRCAILAASPED